MIYITDNLFNYFIYLFLCHFGFRLSPRKPPFFLAASAFTMLLAGAFNAYFDINSPIVYMIWSVLSISLFFESSLLHLIILSMALMYFTGIMDTFTVMLVQIVLVGGGIAGTDITWWMESAYMLSFLVYVLIYIKLLRKNEVYLCDIGLAYKLALLIQGGIFQTFYNFVFIFFDENQARYGWDAYAVFFVSIVGAIYSIFLTLSLAIKNVLSDRQNKELQSFMEMQKRQYDYQLRQSAAIRRFRHDLVNHMGVLKELLARKKTEEARDYIDKIWNMQADFDLKIHTGDSFLDVIVNYYFYLAEKEKIDLAFSGKLTEKMPLDMVDLTSLMGNILQNALEAAGKAATPRIRMELVDHQKEIFILVSNSVREPIQRKRGFFPTTKRDKENHGFGMKNIAAAVKKYHGEYYIDSLTENGENIFQIRISIPKENRVCK